MSLVLLVEIPSDHVAFIVRDVTVVQVFDVVYWFGRVED